MEWLHCPRAQLDLMGDGIQLELGVSQVGAGLEHLANCLVVLYSRIRG